MNDMNEEVNKLWNDNLTQFARLLAEINATQTLNYESLSEQTDLTLQEIDELFERANDVFNEKVGEIFAQRGIHQ